MKNFYGTDMSKYHSGQSDITSWHNELLTLYYLMQRQNPNYTIVNDKRSNLATSIAYYNDNELDFLGLRKVKKESASDILYQYFDADKLKKHHGLINRYSQFTNPQLSILTLNGQNINFPLGYFVIKESANQFILGRMAPVASLFIYSQYESLYNNTSKIGGNYIVNAEQIYGTSFYESGYKGQPRYVYQSDIINSRTISSYNIDQLNAPIIKVYDGDNSNIGTLAYALTHELYGSESVTPHDVIYTEELITDELHTTGIDKEHVPYYNIDMRLISNYNKNDTNKFKPKTVQLVLG